MSHYTCKRCGEVINLLVTLHPYCLSCQDKNWEEWEENEKEKWAVKFARAKAEGKRRDAKLDAVRRGDKVSYEKLVGKTLSSEDWTIVRDEVRKLDLRADLNL